MEGPNCISKPGIMVVETRNRYDPEERVLVLSRSGVLCEGLKSIVDNAPRWRLAGVVAEVEELLQMAMAHHPKIVLLALTNGCDKEMEAVGQLTAQLSDLAVLVLDNQPSPSRLNGFLLAGARGYFSIEANLGELLASAELDSPGLFRADAHLAELFRPQLGSGTSPVNPALVLNGKKLNSKERELLHLIAMGKTNQQIAEALNFSLSTVKNTCQRLFTKMGVENRLQAAMSMYNGWSDDRP